MAYKNHQSAQLGIEQLVLLYTKLNAVVFFFFLDLHVILIMTCAACHPDRYAARNYPRMWPKAKIKFTVFFFVLKSHTKYKNKFVHKNFNLNERIFLNANSKPQSITQGKTFNE